MATYGWMINLTGNTIPVYSEKNGGPSTTTIGKLTKNECFIEGTFSENPWEGDGNPVFFLNSNHNIKFGLIKNFPNTLVDFSAYASNGTSWIKTNSLERKVQYITVAYYGNGSKCCDLPAGSKVWLTKNATAGETNPNYVAVSKVVTSTGKTYTFSGNGFVDLTYGGRWVNVGSILLRKV